MFVRLAVLTAALTAVPFLAPVEANAPRCCAPVAADSSSLEPIRALLGKWVALDEAGKPTDTVISIFKETAGGSAIVETLFPGQPEEMMSIYSVDDGELVLQHYCIMGNQPRYVGSASEDGKSISFRCAGGGNLKDHDRAHMHEGTMKFVSADRLDTRWVAIAKGATVEDVKFQVARVRDAVK